MSKDVCFPPESGHVRCTSLRLLWANNGHWSATENEEATGERLEHPPMSLRRSILSKADRGWSWLDAYRCRPRLAIVLVDPLHPRAAAAHFHQPKLALLPVAMPHLTSAAPPIRLR